MDSESDSLQLLKRGWYGLICEIFLLIISSVALVLAKKIKVKAYFWCAIQVGGRLDPNSVLYFTSLNYNSSYFAKRLSTLFILFSIQHSHRSLLECYVLKSRARHCLNVKLEDEKFPLVLQQQRMILSLTSRNIYRMILKRNLLSNYARIPSKASA